MKQRHRLFSLILAFLFVAGTILAGCSSDKQSKDGAKNEETEKSTNDAAPSGDTLSFSVTLPSFGKKIEDAMVQKEWVAKMESLLGKKLDIKFNYIPISEYSDKSKLLLASGNLTDLVLIMDKGLFNQYEEEGMFKDLSPYKDELPNYMNLVDQATSGEIKAIRSDGKFYGLWNINLPRQAKDKGMGVYTPATYRYDIFEKNNMKLPNTIDELYEAAKKLKELYPKSFPVNTLWNSFDSLFFANHNGGAKVYWNGEKYVFGPTEESYKEALQFANKLYAEKLLDPEVFSDKDDAIKKKIMNGTNSILLQSWFNFAADWNRSATGGEKFVISLFPDNPKYGKAWQSINDFSTVGVDQGAVMVVNAKAKNAKELVQLMDLQYKPDIIELVTWGIEGTTFTRGADGKPTFVDSIKKADNAWEEGDKYGMRASSSYRPGLQMAIDTMAFVDFAPNDLGYVNGNVIEKPWETAFADMPFPNAYTPPMVNEPFLEFTDDEREQMTSVMSPINTFVAEMQNKFINGKESFDNWSAFQDKMKKTGDIDKVLQIYADAQKRYQDRLNK
ncbi:extracellular solute-binding protein [Cohnella nanjingensis]|uniref:Extracellular solute-binding protein n=1 Tax=Cohnella nanjingensis TaxID=1387779 RepID=A0A7X0RVS6_9BACL|nr:extracellular solute-binding protein [Cohnella nanjingensis]MBB6674533.1 extracellular solute-binding protein [Cohnella nanjingensis]